MLLAILSRSSSVTGSGLAGSSPTLIEVLNIAIVGGWGVARTSDSVNTDRPPSVYRRPVRPSTRNEKPELLSITFGSGSEKRSSCTSPLSAPARLSHRAPANAYSGCLRTLTGVACRISELVIDAADPDLLAAFWSEVLGYVELGREDDGSIEIGPPDVGFGGPQPTLVLSPSTDPRTAKLRLHIDVNATDRDQNAELERLLALGARPADVGQTGAESWHVLADPEGNEFCLLRTRLQPL